MPQLHSLLQNSSEAELSESTPPGTWASPGKEDTQPFVSLATSATSPGIFTLSTAFTPLVAKSAASCCRAPVAQMLGDEGGSEQLNQLTPWKVQSCV